MTVNGQRIMQMVRVSCTMRTAMYDGEWVDGVKSGYGIYIYNSADKFEGEWHNDMKHGFGKLYLTNGDTYVGHW